MDHVTVGVGEPEIGTAIFNVSPTVDCILRQLADRHTAGNAEIRLYHTFSSLLVFSVLTVDFTTEYSHIKQRRTVVDAHIQITY